MVSERQSAASEDVSRAANNCTEQSHSPSNYPRNYIRRLRIPSLYSPFCFNHHQITNHQNITTQSTCLVTSNFLQLLFTCRKAEKRKHYKSNQQSIISIVAILCTGNFDPYCVYIRLKGEALVRNGYDTFSVNLHVYFVMQSNNWYFFIKSCTCVMMCGRRMTDCFNGGCCGSHAGTLHVNKSNNDRGVRSFGSSRHMS